ncbi:MAG: CPBP family intramembrane metalloprotease, partial [Clostridiales bacterium]|nr:CPBP family intramembrane metalloprotease [Clostridiales bacterium]
IFGSADMDSISTNEFYLKTFILQISIIGLPPLLYLLYKRVDVSSTIRLNKIKLKEALLVIGMAIFGYGIVLFINYIWMYLISFVGPPIPQPTPPVKSGGNYIVALICIAIMPAVVEEFLFRGVVLRSYEKMGKKVSVIMSGLLFALLHMNLASLPSIIFLGIIISYLVQRSDSIISGFLYHFTNNTIAITIVYISNMVLSKLDDLAGPAIDDISDMPIETFLAGLIGVGIIALFSLGMFILCLKAFKRSTEDRALRSHINISLARENVRPIEMLPAAAAMVAIGALLVFEVFMMVAMR